MTKPIIYLSRNFRQELLDQLTATAPAYAIKYQLQPLDLPHVEISLGWNQETAAALAAPQSRLRWVQTISAGVDTLPLSALAESSILLSNASGIHSIAISEHVIGVILAYYRGLIPAVQRQTQHVWDPQGIHYEQLSGKKLLIIGTGHIGQQLAASVKSLGVDPYGINTTGHPSAPFTETYAFKNMAKIAQDMDIVVNILPLTTETAGIYDQTFFAGLKKSAVFINVGRGASLQTDALEYALKNQLIRFAALDVLAKEPLAADSPLWSLPNLLITPHIAGQSADFQKKLMAIFLPNLSSFLESQTLKINQVDLSKGY